MQLLGNCIVRDLINPEVTFNLSFPETNLSVAEQVMLVRWKQSYHRKHCRELGHGMSAVLIHERPFIIYDLDTELFVQSFARYQEYDENSDELKLYLYGHSKDETKLAQLKSILDTYETGLIVSGDRFVEINGASALSLQDLEHRLHAQRVPGILSLLFGLFVSYGQSRGQDGTLHNVVINLPLTGNIMQYYDLLIKSLNVLGDHGMYMQWSEKEVRNGNILEIHIADWEILYHFAKWLKPVVIFDKISKYDTAIQYKDDLIKFLEAEEIDKKLKEKIEYSVLKTLEK